MKKWAILALFLIGFAGYFYFFGAHTGKIEIAPAQLTVGWIGTLTGPARILGVDNLNAVKLALFEYERNKAPGDPKISLVTADDEYSDAKTMLEYNKMIKTAKPVAIMVCTYSGLKQVAAKALEDSILLVNPIDNDQKISTLNHNIFLIAKETEGLAGVVANAIIDQNKKNIAVIYYGDDDFMRTLAGISNEILQNNGNKVRMFEYKRGTSDFNSLLEKAKADNSDGYVFYGYQEIGYAMKQARDMGVRAQFYSVNVITDPVLQQNSQGAVNGTYFAHFTSLDGNRVKTDEFLNNYFKAFHMKPALEWTAMQGYDAATILFSAIRTAGSQEGNFIDNLRKQLLETSNFEGISGNISILPSGASRGIYPRLYILEDGKALPAPKV